MHPVATAATCPRLHLEAPVRKTCMLLSSGLSEMAHWISVSERCDSKMKPGLLLLSLMHLLFLLLEAVLQGPNVVAAPITAASPFKLPGQHWSPCEGLQAVTPLPLGPVNIPFRFRHKRLRYTPVACQK